MRVSWAQPPSRKSYGQARDGCAQNALPLTHASAGGMMLLWQETAKALGVKVEQGFEVARR